MGRKRDSLIALFRPSKLSQDVYQYKSLSLNDSIRILELKTSPSHQAPIHSELKEVQLSSNTQYEALSYVWGSDDTPEMLNLPGGHLKITENLAAALRGLRCAKESRLLWVDAVCINQKDDDEKSSQVAKMASVYKNASIVLAWLGVDSEAAPVDMEVIMTLSRKSKGLGLGEYHTGQRDVFMAWLRGQPTAFTQAMDFKKSAEKANFSLIYSHDWFTRMWIVQEALLATRLTLCHGSHSLPWEDFQRVAILLHTIRDTLRLSMPNADFFMKHSWNLVTVRNHHCSFPERSDRTKDLEYYADQLRRRDCKDDRDRVYALKSLLPEGSGLTITPDYTKTVVEVFTDLATQQIRHGNIDILYQAGLCRKLESALSGVLSHTFPAPEPISTWVPDYRKNISYVAWMPHFGDESSFLPDSTTPPACTISVGNPRRLTTQVTFLDVISATLSFPFVLEDSLRADHPRIFFMMRTALKELYTRFMAGHASRAYPNGEDPSSAFAHTLFGGGTTEEYKKQFARGVNDEIVPPLQVWQDYQAQCLSEDGQLYQEMLREVESTEPAKRVNGIRQEWYQTTKHSGKAWEVTHYLKVVFRFHVFFSTNKGYIGLAPVGTRKDFDAVAFIDGLKVPFVLRDVEESVWNLVGPCYMHGMMDVGAGRIDRSIGTRLIFNID